MKDKLLEIDYEKELACPSHVQYQNRYVFDEELLKIENKKRTTQKVSFPYFLDRTCGIPS